MIHTEDRQVEYRQILRENITHKKDSAAVWTISDCSLYIQGNETSPNTDQMSINGRFTPGNSEIKCKIRLYLQTPGIIGLILS